MRQHLNIGQEPNLQKIIITSAVLHLLFITLATVPMRSKEREYKSYFVNIVGPVEVRRAVKAPAKKKATTQKGKKAKKAQKEAIKVKPALKKRVRPKSKADMTLEPDKKVAKEIERLRAISSLSRLKKEKESQRAKAKKGDEEIAEAIEGIRKKKLISVSKGAGIPGTQTSMDSDSYYALVTREIWSEWIFPDFDASGLEVIISIKIARDGKVISQEIEKSSGNTLFDRSATKAISKASPLSPPPVEMEIGVRFYL
jgi:colicin import membrane protein